MKLIAVREVDLKRMRIKTEYITQHGNRDKSRSSDKRSSINL